ncbi:MAG: DUF928 domain-containing protein [Leptolyngbya sp. SIO3F4]|nr:DUF928 domain-containing protein [Leptolyngbya sp. SIO3F4]
MKYGLLLNLVWFTYSGLGVWLAVVAPSFAVTFVPPDDNISVAYGSGGASRGRARFIPPQDNSAPVGGDGGASRTGFTPPPDNSAPGQSGGGASRVGFIPSPDDIAPDQAAGGVFRVGFIPPPDNATPQDTASGASRTGANDSFVLFSPEYNGHLVNGQAPIRSTAMLAVTPLSLYGLTVSARPTIMAYLPETNAHTAIFSLKDEDESVIYRQVVSLNGADGILRFILQEDAPELSIGKDYQWFVTLQTDEYITPASPYVTAWIKRVDMAAVMGRTDLPTGLAKAKALAQAGIWYDAAEQLAQLQIDPQTQVDTADNWTEFLMSVELDMLLDHSFLLSSSRTSSTTN